MTSNHYNPSDPNLIYLQSRAETDPTLIEEYAEAMAAGAQFPALKAIGEQHTVYIYDGYHRGQAAQKTGLPLYISVKPGTKAEAEWLALAANQDHGLRRSNADKQKIVRLALAHEFGAKLSDRQLAAHCGVSHPTVARIREEMEATGKIYQSTTRLGADGREINVGNIGSRPAPLPEPDPATAPRGMACPHCGSAVRPAADDSLKCINAGCDSQWPNLTAYQTAASGPQPGEAELMVPPAPAEACTACGKPGRFDTYGTGRRICFQCWLASSKHEAATPQLTPAEDPAAEVRRQLGRALNSYSVCWTEHRQAGLSNSDLVEEIAQAFGMGKGASGPGDAGYWSSGGTNPRFWLGHTGYHSRPPTLAGAALRDAARELLQIPFPREATEPAEAQEFGPATQSLAAYAAAEAYPKPDSWSPSTPGLAANLTYRCQRAGIRFGALLEKIKTANQADWLDQVLGELEAEIAGDPAKASEATR